MNLALALLIIYSVALIGIGLWIARLVRGSGEFFVAGRTLGAPLLFSTVLASNIGAGSTVGAAGLAYRDGLSAWWWNGSAAIGSIALAFWIGPTIRDIAARHNLYTAGDYLELRYGKAVRGLVASLLWAGTLAILAGQLMAGAAVLTVVAGVPHWAGALIGGVVMTIYFAAGGLLSSAWVNLVQLVVLLGGFAIAVPIVLAGVGGLEALAGRGVPATFLDVTYSRGPGSGWMLLASLGPAFIVSPGLLQKVYGARSARAVRAGVGAQAAALMAFAFIPVLLGMAARVAHPGIEKADLVLPTVLIEQLPPALGALGLAAVFSAEVSTCDAILFMLSTSLSQDLYRQFINPAAGDRQLLRVARLAAVAGGALGVALAIALPGGIVTALRIFYALLSVSLFVPVVGGLYTRRAGRVEALAAIAAGIATLLVVQLATRGRGVGPIDPTLAGILAAAAAFVVVMRVRMEGGPLRPAGARHG